MGNRKFAAGFLSRLPWLLAMSVGLLALYDAANAAVPAPPPFSIIHAGRLLATPGKPPVDAATIELAAIWAGMKTEGERLLDQAGPNAARSATPVRASGGSGEVRDDDEDE